MFQSSFVGPGRKRAVQKSKMASTALREYFYYVNQNGLLFLEETTPKNFMSSLKDRTFLDFFFRRVTRNTTGRHNSFPFVSLCGREMNFVRTDPATAVFATPYVFHDLVLDQALTFAGTLSVPFEPTEVRKCAPCYESITWCAPLFQSF